MDSLSSELKKKWNLGLVAELAFSPSHGRAHLPLKTWTLQQTYTSMQFPQSYPLTKRSDTLH